jgi:hypothetical protein
MTLATAPLAAIVPVSASSTLITGWGGDSWPIADDSGSSAATAAAPTIAEPT